MTVVEVFADVGCPFTHVGLRRFVEQRAALGRDDVQLVVRAWPLEVVNGTPLEAHFIAEEVGEIRAQAAPDLFRGFREAAFPTSTMPAMALTSAAYRRDVATGERVALEVRRLLFEEGVDVGDPEVLGRLATEHGVDGPIDDVAPVLADHALGVERGVVGSPHFFTSAGGFFCPSLDVHRDDAGELVVGFDAAGFDRFMASCFG